MITKYTLRALTHLIGAMFPGTAGAPTDLRRGLEMAVGPRFTGRVSTFLGLRRVALHVVGLGVTALVAVSPVFAQTPLTNGGNHAGTISTPGEVDSFTFAAAFGDHISLSVGEVFPGGPDPDFNPWMSLIGPDSNQIASNTAVNDAQIVVSAPLSGQYTVLVSDASLNTPGSYLLHFVLAPGAIAVPDGDQGGALTNGGNHAGTMHLGDLDPWTFVASQNDSIHLSVGEVFVGEVDPGFQPYLRLIGPTGALIGTNTAVNDAQISLDAPLSGTYTVIVIDSAGDNTLDGHYLLHFVLAPAPFVVPAGDHGGMLTNGGNHPGTIHLGDLDPWTFVASQNDSIHLSVGEVFVGEVDPGFQPYLRLIGPTGGQIATDAAVNDAQISLTAPLSGTYTVIVIDSAGDNTLDGHYLLHFVTIPGTPIIPSGDEGGPMTTAVAHPGTIHLGDLDPWSCTTTAGSAITVSIGETGGNTSFTPLIRLISPAGAQIGSRFGSTSAVINNVIAPLTGTYLVIVADSVGSNEGTYEVTMSGAVCTVASSAGPVPRDIVDLDGDGNSDAFLYQATTGAWANQFAEDVGGFTGNSSAWSPGWTVTPARFNNDEFTDFFLFHETSGQWFKMLNDGAGGYTPYDFAAWGTDWERFVVDLDGDGISDVFLWNAAAGQWFQCLTQTDGSFAYVHGFWSAGWEILPMRFNDDAQQDFFLFNRTSAQWFWAVGGPGPTFTYPHSAFWSTDWEFYPGDYTGDGLTDLFLFRPSTGFWFVATAGDSGFTYTSGFFSAGFDIHPVDLDADGAADLFLHKPTTGQWFQLLSNGIGGFANVGGGAWSFGWIVQVGDFNGDGRGDLLLYSPANGAWFQARNLATGTFSYSNGIWASGLEVIGSRPAQ